MVHEGSGGAWRVQVGPGGSRMVQKGPGGFRRVQEGSGGSRRVLEAPGRLRRVQTGHITFTLDPFQSYKPYIFMFEYIFTKFKTCSPMHVFLITASNLKTVFSTV